MKMFLLATGLLFSASAFAKHYGAAGCGLGSIVMGKSGNQVIASTTNGTSGSQTFGITSGTSNCVDHHGQKMSLTPYIETNQQQLLSEMAKGRGEALAGLAHLMGCANQQALNTTLQQHLPDAATSDLTDHIYQVARKNTQLGCTLYL